VNAVTRTHRGTWTCTLAVKLVSVSNLREHWSVRSKRAKAHRFAAGIQLHAARAQLPALPVTVTLTRIAPRTLDDDNLRGAAKALRDGVADAYQVDDRDPRIVWAYDQRRGKPREYGVEIRIEARR
jgi:hypothetical protein